MKHSICAVLVASQLSVLGEASGLNNIEGRREL